jgi:WD40 repeat protein
MKPVIVASSKFESPPLGIQFSQDGQSLYAYVGDSIHAWGMPGFELRRLHSVDESESSNAGYCRFFGDRKSIVLIASEDDIEEGIHSLSVRDLESFEQKVVADIRLPQYGLLTILFNRTEDHLLLSDCGSNFSLLEFPSCKEISSFKMASARGKIYSPDESEIWATGSESEHDEHGHRDFLSAHAVHTGALLRRQPPERSQFLNGLQVTPDDRFLLVVEEKTLDVYDVETWQLYYSIPLPAEWEMTQPVFAFSPNGQVLALSSDSTDVFVVDCKNWQMLETLKIPKRFAVRHLDFSPAGKFLAVPSWDSAKEIQIWDLSSIAENGHALCND